MKPLLESLLFACRWLLAPFFLALVVALLALLAKVGQHAWRLAVDLPTLSEEDVILGALGIVDLTLCGCLVVLVVVSTYSNFLAKLEAEAHRAWPAWMMGIDYGELKLKLIASIVAISAIKLLEAYMNIEHESDRQLGWRTGVFAAFVAASLLLALAERVGHGSEE